MLFRYVWYERLAEEFQSKIHIFSSFFHTRLKDASRDNKQLKCVDVIVKILFDGGFVRNGDQVCTLINWF